MFIVIEMDHFLQFNVNLYIECPQGEEQLCRQINMVRDRLILYQILKAREDITSEELHTELQDNPLRHLLQTVDHPDVISARYSDYISHWTLKVAYSETYPSFFMKNEIKWFRMRFDNMAYDKKVEFLQSFPLMEATVEELSVCEIRHGKWYKVPFLEAPSLLRLRMCPLARGFMYIPEDKMVFWLEDKLARFLTTSLKHCKQMLPSICDQLQLVISGFDLVKPTEYETLGNFFLCDLEKNAQKFPLCMKFQYENLKKHHHLKHFSRIQFGLFLKGLGLSLDDALEMWKREFTQKMTENQFCKQYSYFFKHQYGTVGSKINYTAQNCDSIIAQDAGPNQIHGCPFKQWENEILIKRLKEEGVTENDVEKIVSLKKLRHFQSACTVYFQNLHGKKLDECITHPIVYYHKACNNCEVMDIEDLMASSESSSFS